MSPVSPISPVAGAVSHLDSQLTILTYPLPLKGITDSVSQLRSSRGCGCAILKLRIRIADFPRGQGARALLGSGCAITADFPEESQLETYVQ